MVARAAPVIMLVEPGPVEAVHAKVWSRFFIFANAAEAWTIACSFRAR